VEEISALASLIGCFENALFADSLYFLLIQDTENE
jgi:hypothetical protein